MAKAILAIYFSMSLAERQEIQTLACGTPLIPLAGYDVRPKGVLYTYTDGSNAYVYNGLILIKDSSGYELYRKQY